MTWQDRIAINRALDDYKAGDIERDEFIRFVRRHGCGVRRSVCVANSVDHAKMTDDLFGGAMILRVTMGWAQDAELAGIP